MARASGTAILGNLSGTFGNAILAKTQDGMVARTRVKLSGRRSPGQMAQDARVALVNRAWQTLTPAEVAAWRTYALGLAKRNPATGGLRVPRACCLFLGFGTKYLQVHGGVTVPSLPPTGVFKGDLLTVTAVGEGTDIEFTADRTNVPGVLTELLAQRLKGRNNLPKTKNYVSLGFVAFEAGVPIRVEIGKPGTWALAIRFVEAGSGRKTEIEEIGNADVTEWSATDSPEDAEQLA